MKMVLINGSPKGKDSISLQHWLFAQKQLPQLELEIIHVGQAIHKLERNSQALDGVIQRIAQSEAVLWTFPVYFLMLPSQLHRFLELIYEKKAEDAFRGKASAYIASSIHYMDHLVDSFMYNLTNTLGLRSMEGYMAAMEDLFHRKEQKRVTAFAEQFCKKAELGIFPLKGNLSRAINLAKTPSKDPKQYKDELNLLKDSIDLKGQRLVIVSDRAKEDSLLSSMVEHLTSRLSGGKWQEINLQEMRLKSGCIGCIACGYDNTCRVSPLDDFLKVYQEEVMTADMVIYAIPVKKGFFSARWKQFIDRQFFRNHRPSQRGLSRGFLLSGPIEDPTLLEQYMKSEAYSQHCNLCGWIHGDSLSGEETAQALGQLVKQMAEVREAKHRLSEDFVSIGAKKVFRDVIFAQLRFPFRQDFLYYKREGFFDFPHRQKKAIRQGNIFTNLSRIKGFRDRVFNTMMVDKMVSPYRAVVDQAGK